MVGNINDMNAEVAIRQYKPPMFCINIVPVMVKMPPIAKNINKRREFTYFISIVLMKRLVKNIVIAIML